MAVDLLPFPLMPAMDGVFLSSTYAGIRKQRADDLVLIALPNSATVAGAFTQNAYCAAPVTLCRRHLRQTANSRYLLINAGTANACTGDRGYQHAQRACDALARATAVNAEQVLPFSTGVIGEPLPIENIQKAIPALIGGLAAEHWREAAEGMMTTDTRPKGATCTPIINGHPVIINGIAKGAGMIKPNMATLLAYIVTDAQVHASLLRRLVKEVADQSFNRITVDGDTSTNDSCILAATGTGAVGFNSDGDPGYTEFRRAVIEISRTLAQAIVKDGEGATKFITIQVEQGQSAQECLQVAYAIAHSPLVKTAFFASDPNWGRIVAAIGYAGLANLDIAPIRVYLDDVLIVENGGAVHLWRNDLNKQSFLRVRLSGTRNNKDGLSSRIVAVSGNTRMERR